MTTERKTKMKNKTTTYQQTEVGLIPSDWVVKTLGEIFEFKNGLNKEKEFFGYGTPIVNYMDVFRNAGIYKSDIVGKVFLTPQEIKNYEVRMGDVFFTRTSETIEEIGITTVVLEELDNTVFSGFVLRGRPKKSILELSFKKYCFSSTAVRKEITTTASYTTRALTNGRLLSNVKIPVPSKSEQTAIATALSDADALISSLEKLIAKKRNIKQGAMQKLLQPKEGWETKTLRELAKYRRGSFPQPYGLDKWYDDTNGYPFVQVYDVDDNFRLKDETKRRISKDAQEMSVYIEKGSVIITLQGSIGRIAITQYDAYVDRTLLFFESFIVPFDKFFFMLSIFRLFELEKEKAPGGIIKTITKEALSSFKISYPKIEEQTKIATILLDMDAEINALETKLEKYKKVKLGMMQNLLTGKIRLI